MARAFLCMLAFLAAAPLAQAQGRGVMAVSATVVNTCVFGLQARCLLQGTSLRIEEQQPAAASTAGRRIVHL